MSDLINRTAAYAAARQTYQRDGRVQIPDFLEKGFAIALLEELIEYPDWNMVFRDNNKHYDLHRSQWQALDDNSFELLRQRITAVGQLGFQYWYYNVPIYDMAAEGKPLGPAQDKLYHFLQSEQFVSCMRNISGEAAIDFADCQATKYTPGSFLTTHDDKVQGKNRHAAYVLGLSPDWCADWGGLLMFPESGQAFTPAFNSLYMFSVPQPHLVSLVSSLATRPRISVTGWLRSAPK